MIIPTQFNLLGHTIRVVFVDKLMSEHDLIGEARYLKNEIALQSRMPGIELLRSDIEQSFLHELVHFILNYMGENELRKNEKFVDLFAGMLHQTLITQEGEQ